MIEFEPGWLEPVMDRASRDLNDLPPSARPQRTRPAAPAAAPVGDEEAREAAAAVIRRARYQPAARADRTFDQHLADELHAAGLLAAPGDEGAARAAVARVVALLPNAVARHSYKQGHGLPDATNWRWVAEEVVAAALSAVSAEHREAEDGQ